MAKVDLELLSIDQLATHSADELLDTMLPAVEAEIAYDDLYTRWERQHWLATEIDFTVDKTDWAEMHPLIRDQMFNPICAFYQGEESVTKNLIPMMLGAPRLEHEIYLTTQTVDEARHMVFFRRFFNEVIGWDGSEPEHLERLQSNLSPYYRNIFFGPDGLDGRAEKLLADPQNRALFVELVTQYHLVAESGLALLGQRALCDIARKLDILPGFTKGFMAITRDESRHVGFGVRVVRELTTANPDLKANVLGVIRTAIPDMVRLAHRPDYDYDPNLLSVVPPDLLMAPQDSHRYSMTHMMKRLSAAGFSRDDVNQIGDYGWENFEAAIGEWESRTGNDHLARMFPDLHAAGPARI